MDLQANTDQRLQNIEYTLQQKRIQLLDVQKETAAVKAEIADQTQELQALKSDIEIIASDNVKIQQILSETYELNTQISSQIGNIDLQIEDKTKELQVVTSQNEVMSIDNKRLLEDSVRMNSERDAL